MNRPVTTLFMLMSVDGKISTGAADVLDVDRDFQLIHVSIISREDWLSEKQKGMNHE